MTTADMKFWTINIENAASEVSALCGDEVVLDVLKKRNADSILDLAPCYYSEVFDDLDYISNEARRDEYAINP